MESIIQSIERAKRRLLILDSQHIEGYSLNIRFLEEEFAVKSILERNYEIAKNHYFTCGLIDELRINKYNDRLLSFGLPYISYPILSDNEELINRYSRLRYNAWGKMKGMDDNVLLGKSDIWCNTVQYFMVNDKQGIERNLNILETITIKKLKSNEKTILIDYNIYKALYENNKNKVEELLEELVSPKIHKKRNYNNVLSEFIALPALGYAKLAWRQGLEVKVNSPLIPYDFLPVKPLVKYEITYDFLK